MTFNNPVVGGLTLIRDSIRSSNYTPGASGWSINRDGSAEFNNITIRGGTVISGTALYYNGTPAANNLTFSISSVSGTDSFGNSYPAGFASHNVGSTVYHQDNSGNITIGASGASNYQFHPSSGGTFMQAYDSNGDLALNFDVDNGVLTMLDNTNSQYIQFNSTTNDTTTLGGITIGYITSPGTMPTQTQLDSGFRLGTSGTGNFEKLISHAGVSGYQAQISLGSTASDTFCNLSTVSSSAIHYTTIDGNLSVLGNWYTNRVSIVPVANTPTGVTISGIGLNAGTYSAFVTADSSVPGSTVIEASANGVTNDGLTVWIYRINTTSTGVFYMLRERD